MYPFLGVTLHWISENWQLRNVGLKLCPLEGPHSGDNLAETFITILNEFELSDKVCLLFLTNNYSVIVLCLR